MAKKAKIEKCPVCLRLICYRSGRFYRHLVRRDYPGNGIPIICEGSNQRMDVLKALGVRNVLGEKLGA